jgi:hypothetical protein
MPLSSSGASTKCSMCLYRHRKSERVLSAWSTSWPFVSNDGTSPPCFKVAPLRPSLRQSLGLRASMPMRFEKRLALSAADNQAAPVGGM